MAVGGGNGLLVIGMLLKDAGHVFAVKLDVLIDGGENLFLHTILHDVGEGQDGSPVQQEQLGIVAGSQAQVPLGDGVSASNSSDFHPHAGFFGNFIDQAVVGPVDVGAALNPSVHGDFLVDNGHALGVKVLGGFGCGAGSLGAGFSAAAGGGAGAAAVTGD